MIVPTGIGASIGGFAGDANPRARLLANVSDYLITHPNVVNGAVLTQIPDNVIIVEGHLLDLFFENKIALRPNVKHRIGIVVDSDISQQDRDVTENCVNAARTFYGLDCLDIIYTKEPVAVSDDLKEIRNIETLFDGCESALEQGASALAVVAKLKDDPKTDASKNYVQGKGYDPIGWIEAQISHKVCERFLVPAAHAPILDPTFSPEGVVDPRVAAEHLALTYLASVLQCLNHSAGILILDQELMPSQVSKKLSKSYGNTLYWDNRSPVASDLIKVSDLANLVVPYDSCNATPMHKSNEYGIQLISVLENKTTLNETAESLDLKHYLAHNYLEAAGVCAANRRDNKAISFIKSPS